MHVVGAGLAGLAAAVCAARAGRTVTVYEAAGHAGGRCRSFFDAGLGRRIDNGNHLVLSGNRCVNAYVRMLDAEADLCGPPRAEFPFIDLRTGERWTLAPNRGPLPWWIFSSRRRVPGSRVRDYLAAVRLAWARTEQTVADCLGRDGPAFERFWEPLVVAALNAAPDEAAAVLLWPVVRETFGRGEAASRPRIARRGLSECFVDPALRFLAARGSRIIFRRRLQGLGVEGDRVSSLAFADAIVIDVAAADTVVLAVPPPPAAALVPDLLVPEGHRAIVNAHFRLPSEFAGGEPRMCGVIGGASQWVFVRGDVASVTISAAHAEVSEDGQGLAERLWTEVCRVLDLGPRPLSAFRIVKEKRATFAETPANVIRRPSTRTRFRNLLLAGDWTNTGLPATIEGSLKSGMRAAEAIDQPPPPTGISMKSLLTKRHDAAQQDRQTLDV